MAQGSASAGASVTASNMGGFTALIQAAAAGDANLVAELLEAVRKSKPTAVRKLLAKKDQARQSARAAA